MLDARFSHLHFCQSLPTPQRGLSAIADLLVLHCNASNLVLTILQHDKIWGGDLSPVPPVIYAHVMKAILFDVKCHCRDSRRIGVFLSLSLDL